MDIEEGRNVLTNAGSSSGGGASSSSSGGGRPLTQEDCAEIVGKAVRVKSEMARMRLKVAGIMNRIQASLDVMARGPMTSEQERCAALIHDACRSMLPCTIKNESSPQYW